MFGHFTTLCMKGSIKKIMMDEISTLDEHMHVLWFLWAFHYIEQWKEVYQPKFFLMKGVINWEPGGGRLMKMVHGQNPLPTLVQ